MKILNKFDIPVKRLTYFVAKPMPKPAIGASFYDWGDLELHFGNNIIKLKWVNYLNYVSKQLNSLMKNSNSSF